MEHEEYNTDEHDENVYSEEGREEFVESGEISAEEEAFMKGYEETDDEESEESDEDEDEEERPKKAKKRR